MTVPYYQMKRAILFFATVVLSAFVVELPANADPTQPKPAVIYTTSDWEHGTRIVWQEFQSQTTHIVRKLVWLGGFLPSPDGQWIVIWDEIPRRDQQGPAKAWEAVRLRDAKVVSLGIAEGSGDLLPYWISATSLRLEAKHARVAFSTMTEKLSGPLSQPMKIAGESEETWWKQQLELSLSYAWNYYPSQTRIFLKMYDKLDAEMNIGEYESERGRNRERKEFMLLRCLGIPGMTQQNYGRVKSGLSQVPRVAVSPDSRLIACSYIYNSNGVPDKGFYRADAQLMVFDVSSGKRIWRATIPSQDWKRVAPPPDYNQWPTLAVYCTAIPRPSMEPRWAILLIYSPGGDRC